MESIFNQGYYENYFNHIKKKNKVPRIPNQVVEGFWKRYTFNNESRAGDNEQIILKRTKGLVSKDYFKKLLNLRQKYNTLKSKFLND